MRLSGGAPDLNALMVIGGNSIGLDEINIVSRQRSG
jgi:hypothetical protein